MELTSRQMGSQSPTHVSFKSQLCQLPHNIFYNISVPQFPIWLLGDNIYLAALYVKNNPINGGWNVGNRFSSPVNQAWKLNKASNSFFSIPSLTIRVTLTNVLHDDFIRTCLESIQLVNSWRTLTLLFVYLHLPECWQLNTDKHWRRNWEVIKMQMLEHKGRKTEKEEKRVNVTRRLHLS